LGGLLATDGIAHTVCRTQARLIGRKAAPTVQARFVETSRGRPVCARSFSVCARFQNVESSRGSFTSAIRW
jgi:hypothetical protein